MLLIEYNGCFVNVDTATNIVFLENSIALEIPNRPTHLSIKEGDRQYHLLKRYLEDQKLMK